MMQLMDLPRMTPRIYPTRLSSGLTFWRCLTCGHCQVSEPVPFARNGTPAERLRSLPCPACRTRLATDPHMEQADA